MRRMQLALVLMAALVNSAHAATFWEEDFENHLYPNWENPCITSGDPDGIGCPYPTISTAQAYAGTHSGYQHYSDINVQSGTFHDRFHTTANEYWIRWYQKTVGFDYGDGSRVVKHLISSGGNWGVYWENQGSSEMYANLTTSANTPCPTRGGVLDQSCNLDPNMASVPLNNGQWYCIEGHISGGTSGSSNGSVEMFVDGVQTVGYYNLGIRFPSDSTAGINMVRYYAQNGFGDRYTDNLAVGNTRIGCAGGGGGGGSTVGGGLDF